MSNRFGIRAGVGFAIRALLAGPSFAHDDDDDPDNPGVLTGGFGVVDEDWSLDQLIDELARKTALCSS